MAGLKKQRRIQLIVLAFVFLGAATALVGYGLRDGIEYYRSPTQVAAEMPDPSERFRLGGLVEDGTIVRGQGQVVSFSVTDGANSVAVNFEGILPDLFREGQGAVMSGSYKDGIFTAHEVLAKHDENYMPKEVIDSLKEQGVYQENATGS